MVKEVVDISEVIEINVFMYDKFYTINVLRFDIYYDIVRDIQHNTYLFPVNGLKLDLKYLNTFSNVK